MLIKSTIQFVSVQQAPSSSLSMACWASLGFLCSFQDGLAYDSLWGLERLMRNVGWSWCRVLRWSCRSLIQILDAEIFDLMQQNGDYTHLYFCYRWFLLDFKRELVYDDVFTVWETIWAARSVASSHFVLFVGLALVQYYREIILANAMDFTDIIKFFNGNAVFLKVDRFPFCFGTKKKHLRSF